MSKPHRRFRYPYDIARVFRDTETTRRVYNLWGRWYDLFVVPFERRYHRRGLAALGVRDGETVLEIAPGNGRCLVSLARMVGDTGKAHAIDLSEEMIAFAQNTIDRAGLSRRVRLVCGNATRLPYDDETFDALFISFALEIFDTPELIAVMRECRRVLKRGGRMVTVSVMRAGRWNPVMWCYSVVQRFLAVVIDGRPIPAAAIFAAEGLRVTLEEKLYFLGIPIAVVKGEKR